MKATLKRKRRRIKKGWSYDLSIVHNFRDPVTNVPTNRTLASFTAIRDSDIPHRAAEFHARLDAELDRLKGEIYANCADEIRRKFEKVIPRPRVTAKSSLKDIRAILAARG